MSKSILIYMNGHFKQSTKHVEKSGGKFNWTHRAGAFRFQYVNFLVYLVLKVPFPNMCGSASITFICPVYFNSEIAPLTVWRFFNYNWCDEWWLKYIARGLDFSLQWPWAVFIWRVARSALQNSILASFFQFILSLNCDNS